jgi:trans-aconitate methyltransferase
MSKFDELAESYTDVLQQNLRFIPGGVDYYTEYRAYFTHRFSPETRNAPTILDFGCGVGTSIPHLTTYFPYSQISACDVSEESVRVASEQYRHVKFTSFENLKSQTFDLIFVAGVFHHIESNRRATIADELCNMLTPNGRICIFELNPRNPITRRLVANCAFDEDAELLTKEQLVSHLTDIKYITQVASRYTVFFPPLFGRLRRLEKLLSWFPYGAQYFVVFEKQSQ